MHDLLHKYNGKEYNFKSITVHSAGVRDPDAEGVEGISASKVRTAAANNDAAVFRSAMPSRVKGDSAKIMAKVRSGMKLSESAAQSLIEKSEKANLPLELITAVYERAIQAHDAREVGYLTSNQYAFTRVNSFVAGGAAWKADKDLREQYLVELRDTNMGLKSIPWEKTTNHGWWDDDDKDHVDVYHGTHDRNIPSIARNGVSHKDAKSGMISVTMDMNTAHGYAAMSGSGGERNFRSDPKAAQSTPDEDRSVVKMRIPKTWMNANMDRDVASYNPGYKDKISKKSSYDNWKQDNPGKSDHEHYALTEFRVKNAIPKKFIVGVMKKKQPSAGSTTNAIKPATNPIKSAVNMNPKLATVDDNG
jgi:hypothetical protein